jgi:hypothetical protein
MPPRERPTPVATGPGEPVVAARGQSRIIRVSQFVVTCKEMH